MTTFEQVKHITRFELASNPWAPLLLLFYGAMLFIIFVSDTLFIESILFDVVFLALFSGGFTFFAKIDSFKPQLIGNRYFASHQVIFLQQFPVKKEAVFNSRVVVHNFYNFIIQLSFVILLYIFSPTLHTSMNISAFIVFVFMWMSVGVWASGFTAADEAGKGVNNRSLAISVMPIIVFAGLLFSLYTWTPYTLIKGSITIANEWPFAGIIGAIILASAGLYYGRRKMYRLLQTTDYIS